MSSRSPIRTVGVALVAWTALAVGVGGVRAGAATAPGVRATPVAAVTGVTALAARPGDPAPWATTKAGQVVALRADGPVTVLDLARRVRTAGEGGLLGLAFSPDGARLYLAHSDEPDGRIVLTEHSLGAAAVTDVAGREILTQPHPALNHFGGRLVTDADGLVHLGLGDGGGAVATSGPNAQDPDSWLGKILRIDPRPTDTAAYRIPADNPFADGGGRPEVAVLGLRNPWSFTFDPVTGALWVADVGQEQREEITRVGARRTLGANLGWDVFEGRRRFGRGSAPAAIEPLVELHHDDGYCSVIGGVVVRDGPVPALRDRYLFSDFCAGRLLAVDADARRPRIHDLGVELPGVTGFALTADGTVLVATLERGIFRLDPT